MSEEREATDFVGAYLSPQRLREFQALKEFYGIERKSDVVRFLIRREASRINAQCEDVPAQSGE